MLGWSILFALASMSGLVATLAAPPASFVLKAATSFSAKAGRSENRGAPENTPGEAWGSFGCTDGMLQK